MIRVTDYFGTFEYYKPTEHLFNLHIPPCVPNSFICFLSFFSMRNCCLCTAQSWKRCFIKHFSTQFINWKTTTRQNPKTMPWDFTDAWCKYLFLKGIYNILLYSQISVHYQSPTILWHCSCSNTFVHLSVQIYYAAILKVILSQFFCRKRISDKRKWIK